VEYAETLLIINPVAGSVSDTEQLATILAGRIREEGRTCTVHQTREDDDLATMVRAACENGVDLVIVAGGDGTVGDAVNGLVGTGVPLGIIPVGTGNLIARATGLPRRAEDAMELILGDHEVIHLDTMFTGGRHYILNISTGISSRSIHDTTPEEKRRFGMLAYIWRIVGHVFGFKSSRYDLLLDGYTRTVDATELLVSNGTLLERLPRVLGPRESFCDNRIDVYVFYGRWVMDYVRIILRTILRLERRDERFMHFPVTREIRIAARRRSQPVQGDGEMIGWTPMDIRVEPGVVPLVTPRAVSDPAPPASFRPRAGPEPAPRATPPPSSRQPTNPQS
jgi:diacylglycerol kinase (ATP)